jgi:glyoxylate/hydroxypyruvate reductase A
MTDKPRVLFAAKPASWASYEVPLRAALRAAGIDAEVGPDVGPPEAVDYIVLAPNGPVSDFSPYTRCKAVLNLWAGVEDVVGNPTLTQPFARMVDEGLTRGMVEWVTGHVLRHHLGMDRQIRKEGGWDALRHIPPLACDRGVTILGLGELGRTCGQALAGLGFAVTGWSRRPKTIEGMTCLSGADGLAQALARAEILVLLLPLTAATENLMDAARLAMLPEGAVIVNPGRGPLIDDDALLVALDTGYVAHATLDVFREEPLPESHPFWAHPRVTVTPHIASETRAATAALVIAENIRRGEAGAPLLHLVDRGAGY